jgi:acyl-CoA thioesterase
MRIPLYKSMRIPNHFIRKGDADQLQGYQISSLSTDSTEQPQTTEITQSDETIFWLSLLVREFISSYFNGWYALIWPKPGGVA